MSVFQVWDARVLGAKWRKYCREDDDIEVCKLNVEMEPCVCAVWLIGLPLARHFHYLIAWKGSRGDCRSLAVWAKRMDLECISIGSKAPAVGGCPRPLVPSWKCRWAAPPPALAAPSPVFLHYHTCLTERPLQLHWGPHMERLWVVPLSWCLQGTAICHTPCSSWTPLFHFFKSDWGPCSPNIST